MIQYHSLYEIVHYMSFKIKDKKLLEKYILILNKIKTIIGYNFDREKFLNTK